MTKKQINCNNNDGYSIVAKQNDNDEESRTFENCCERFANKTPFKANSKMNFK